MFTDPAAVCLSVCLYSECLSESCTGCQSYCVGLWTGHRYREPILLAAHASWSLGGTIGPFIVARFLVELSPAETSLEILHVMTVDGATSWFIDQAEDQLVNISSELVTSGENWCMSGNET